MRERTKDRRLDVILTPDAHARLVHLTQQTGMTKGQIVSTLLESYDFKPVGDGENAEYFASLQENT